MSPSPPDQTIQVPSRAYHKPAGYSHTNPAPSSPSSAAGPSRSPTTSRYGSLRNVVQAVSSSFRPRGGAPPTPPAAWQTTPWQNDEFPILDEDLIKCIWQGDEEGDKYTRKCVAQAVEEMQLNWKLDPKLVGGERSEANQGYATIVAFLQRVARVSATEHVGGGSKVLSGASGSEDGAEDQPTSISSNAAGSTARPVKTYERHDLLRAIERQDHETILMIRNSNFDLLLDSAPGTSSSSSSNAMQTPLGYAISLGPNFTGTAVVLTGAMSKYVNTLPDEQVYLSTRRRGNGPGTSFDPRTMERLRKLRGTLKLAVDHSLATDQTQLLSSYVQVLFMSSGTSFITDSIATLCTSLRACFSSSATATSDPVSEARESILQFVNHSLKKRDKVAAVSDLVDNAAGDLVVMAAWELVRLRESEDEELCTSLPTYAFARDDRITGLFIARVSSLQAAANNTTSAATPLVLRRVVALKDALQGLDKGLRRLSATERIAVLRSAISGGAK